MKTIEEAKEFESVLLAVIHEILNVYLAATMGLVFRLFGLRKGEVHLRHAEIYLVTTTVLLTLLVGLAQIWPNGMVFGWSLVVFGNIRLLQIVCINLNTLMFDYTPVGKDTQLVKRARWHLVAIAFSLFDAILIFGFMYQFFDHHYEILSQHFPHFFGYLYHSVMTIMVTGYGDIVPVTAGGRLVAMYETVMGLFFLVFLVSGALARLRYTQAQQ